ncbi:LytTR family two component transcriptional regulator [Paenibacillus alvei TS-15]|jgi:two-component system, LytTR family, response regulator LytT|uniref:LytTR family two component transcriptional regulator n=1 Tax=Paenibacillus alvei TS-15 TaxID=1117108 RepID=S9U943_PAEAL|nr:LytTR family transcriptional regulator DNA-binding domain-containing protein [Paenibacillus alvei]EPY07015.1 LytTR family two component transcriptional regulator [Paenibacillus alvei TS-15]
MLKAFIVDDEPLARDELCYLLRRTKRVDVVGEAESMEEALKRIGALRPDVVFLDIQLAEASGLEAAERLGTFDEPPAIVFATAYDEYALRAFELNAADYILKPFDEQRIQLTIEKLEKQGSRSVTLMQNEVISHSRPTPTERVERLAITTVDERIVVLHVDRIVYIGFVEGKTVVATTEQRYRVGEPLSVLERKLNHPSIIRVHRAYLVNVDRIVEIEPWFHSTCQLKMQDGSSLPVSRTYMKELKQLLGF